jgi:hypothetical protein
LYVAHTTFRHLRPWPLAIIAVSLSVVVFALVRAPCAAFRLHTHVPPVSLPVRPRARNQTMVVVPSLL